MKRILYLFVSFLIFTTCNNEVIITKKYFKNGELKSKSYFNPDSGETPYLVIEYDMNGMPVDTFYFNDKGKKNRICYSQKDNYEIWTNYVNGIRQGQSKRQFSDGKKFKDYYLNDMRFGVSYRYDPLGRLFQEVLWVGDSMLMYKKILHIPKNETYSYIAEDDGKTIEKEIHTKQKHIVESYFASQENEQWIPTGILIYDSVNVLIDSELNNYLLIESNDTIKKGQPLNVMIQGIGDVFNANKTEWKMKINSINPQNYKQVQTIEMIVSGLKNRTTYFPIHDYLPGYNVIWGSIESEEAGIMYFYLDFFVKE